MVAEVKPACRNDRVSGPRSQVPGSLRLAGASVMARFAVVALADLATVANDTPEGIIVTIAPADLTGTTVDFDRLVAGV